MVIHALAAILSCGSVHTANFPRSAVQALVREPDPSWETQLAAIQAMDGRVQDRRSDMHLTLQLQPVNISSSTSQNLLLIHIMYHVCLCALHSSIVPLFSWSATEGASAYTQQLSAQTALQHANAISTYLESVQSAQYDFSRLHGFIGYAAYCASAVHLPFLWCTMSEVRNKAHANLLTNLAILREVGKYWKYVEALVSILMDTLLPTAYSRRDAMFAGYMRCTHRIQS